MQSVFVLNSNKEPLMPCHPARARILLRNGRAKVFRRYPFVIILTKKILATVQPIEIKFDPGSRTTGIALVGEFQRGRVALFGANLEHRGLQIKASLDSRRAVRRGRRCRNLRYRPARFNNRCRPEGWLPPSLMSRVNNVSTWTRRLISYCPITSICVETVRFDTQLMERPEISGVEYQQGTLAGYELRESVSFWSGGRTKFNRTIQGYEKDHWIDAVCVGETGENVSIPKIPLKIR